MAEKGEQMVQFSDDDILSVQFTQFSSPTPKNKLTNTNSKIYSNQ